MNTNTETPTKKLEDMTKRELIEFVKFSQKINAETLSNLKNEIKIQDEHFRSERRRAERLARLLRIASDRAGKYRTVATKGIGILKTKREELQSLSDWFFDEKAKATRNGLEVYAKEFKVYDGGIAAAREAKPFLNVAVVCGEASERIEAALTKGASMNIEKDLNEIDLSNETERVSMLTAFNEANNALREFANAIGAATRGSGYTAKFGVDVQIDEFGKDQTRFEHPLNEA